MKNIKSIYIKSTLVLLTLAVLSCTGDFDELNVRPNAVTPSSASPTGFIGTIERLTFNPDREVWWRAQLIHADRFADHFRFGFNGSWWNDGLGYEYHVDYTDWYWRDYYTRVPANINEYLKVTGEGGTKANQNLYAIGLVLKAGYYQLITDSFGDVPYTQVADGATLAPKYDEQKEIYRQSIADLGKAIAIFGSQTEDAVYKDQLATDDLIFKGDLSKWAKYANALRLRMGMRALGASGADFATTAINESLSKPLPSTIADLAKIDKDPKATASSAYLDDGYNRIWWTFDGLGSKWTVSKSLIDILRNNNDPRLPRYAKPAAGGTIEFAKTADGKFDKYYTFIKAQLNAANVVYTESTSDTKNTLTVPANTYYVGQPARLNGNIGPYVKIDLFSLPSDYVISDRDRNISMMPAWVFSPAEAEFLQAWANLKGFTTASSANAHYRKGIALAMEQFNVAAEDIEDYLADEPIATLTGSTDAQIGQVATQLWVSLFGNGFEAWANVRKTGYPTSAAKVETDVDIYYLGSLGAVYPQRLRYSSNETKLNQAHVSEAVGRQGADALSTEVWWAKD